MPKQEDTTENGSCFPSVILNAYQCMVTHFGYNIYVNKLTSSSFFFEGGGRGEARQRSYDHLRTNRTFNIIRYQVKTQSQVRS